MHKKPAADKKSRSRKAAACRPPSKAPLQISDLLRRGSVLRELSARIPEQQSWAHWLRGTVPAELAEHIVNVVPRPLRGEPAGTELIVYADSPAWCTRLRYALSGLEAHITSRDAAVQRTRVRVSLD